MVMLQGELVVANVFVRVYNEQPTFPVSDPASLCKGLVSYLHMQAQSSWFRDASSAAPASQGARISGACAATLLEYGPCKYLVNPASY